MLPQITDHRSSIHAEPSASATGRRAKANRSIVWWSRLIATILSLMLVAEIARGDDGPLHGTVQTVSVRLSGDLAMERDGVRVDGQRLDWDQLLTLSVERPSRVHDARSNVVYLAGVAAERWPGRIQMFDGEQLVVDLHALGERTLPREALAAIDFVADLPWPPRRRGVLVHQEAEPMPATLTRLDGQILTLDTPLGEIQVDRALARRYVFDRNDSVERAGGDVLTLVNGAVLLGDVRAGAAGLTIKHRWLGEVQVQWPMVESLRRRGDDVIYLADLDPAEQTAEPLLVDALALSTFVTPVEIRGAIDAWALQPMLRQVYELPASITAEGTSLRLRAQVRPIKAARGAVALRVVVDGKVVRDAVIQPGDEPRTLDVSLGAGRRIALEVNYDEPKTFPLGVIWMDPIVLLDK